MLTTTLRCIVLAGDRYFTYSVTSTTLVLLVSALSLALALLVRKWVDSQRRRASKNYPPTPRAWPIIGHLHLLAPYQENPWEGFDALRQQYGNVVGLRLGVHKTVMVSSGEIVREVLLQKGEIFAHRPNFNRYQLIFGGNRDNSLALCDWSELQRTRRIVATIGLLPRFGSALFNQLDSCIQTDVRAYLGALSSQAALSTTNSTALTKLDLLAMCANIFTNYLCSKRFDYDDVTHRHQLYNHDFVFYDINQCYGVDFLPFLPKFGVGRAYLGKLTGVCDSIRKYMEEILIKGRVAAYESGARPSVKAKHVDLDDSSDGDSLLADRDFLDLALQHHFDNPEVYPWEAAVYEVLDLIGGHSAVGNLLMRLLGLLSLDPEAQEAIYEEATAALADDDCQSLDDDYVNLNHRSKMPFTEAAILETLRLASSPIVPHVAAKDSNIQGFDVDEGTMVLFNTYNLNMSEKYWDEPKKFNPRRFLVPVGGKVEDNNNGEPVKVRYQVNKPDNFFPFSAGRRACLGYKMVTTITFTAAANLCMKFKLSPDDRSSVARQLVPKGSLALCPDTGFGLVLSAREP